MNTISPELIKDFIANFYGYGNLKSKYWFISLEEGGGKQEQEVIARIESWNLRGRKTVEDCKSFHQSIGVNDFFNNSPKFQPVWKRYIRILQVLLKDKEFLNLNHDKQDSIILDYQRNSFANENGDICLLELRPLPSPKTSIWNYGDKKNFSNFSKLSFLKDRDTYENKIHPGRIKRIKKLIEIHNPQFVIFFSDSIKTKEHWKEIIGGTPKQLGSFYCQKRNGINYLIAKHTIAVEYDKKFNSEADKNNYFNELAQHILDLSGSLTNIESKIKEKDFKVDIDNALEILLDAIIPYSEKKFLEIYGQNWINKVKEIWEINKKGYFPKIKNNRVEWDVAAILKLIDINKIWFDVFDDNHQKKERSYITEILQTRHEVSHKVYKQIITKDNAIRALDTILLLSQNFNNQEVIKKIKDMKNNIIKT